jgi:predicted nicotinamide N-methyase
MNAERNAVTVNIHRMMDMEKPFTGADLILAGDVCYQQAMATVVLRWLGLCRAQGVRVLIADPGRAYVPKEGLKELARYEVPTSREIEDRESRTVVVWELLPSG